MKEEIEWISVKDRMPGKPADPYRSCVLIKHRIHGVITCPLMPDGSFLHLEYASPEDDPFTSHWAHMPKGPDAKLG